MPLAVLFDLDGTLSDPLVGISAGVDAALVAVGRKRLSSAQARAFVGPPLQDSFAQIGLSPGEVTVAVAAYREYYSDRGLYENELYPGIPEMLEELRSDGFQMAVATSKPTPFAHRIIEHFDLSAYFCAVVGSHLDGSRRHKHEVIEDCLQRLPSIAAVMVGDRSHDILGAKHHAMPSIGVIWGFGTRTELIEAGATRLVTAPGDVGPTLVALTPTS